MKYCDEEVVHPKSEEAKKLPSRDFWGCLEGLVTRVRLLHCG